MHVPDGFLDAPTSMATGVVAASVVALSLRRSRDQLDDRVAPLAGLVAVFVFAGQMINFPVGAGTSGHLLGGALAAVLVGPWVATLCLTVVLAVQGLLFADGGLTALGTNVVLMGIVGVWVGWGAFWVARRLLPTRLGSVPVAAAIGGFLSVPCAALTFVLLYAVGGAAPIPLGALATAMTGWHVVIGLGEAAITFVVVASLVRTRPDLVVGARDLLDAKPLEIRQEVTA
ncbi:MAG TPA: energy-coupling factor ABC transporter permease [Phycicoccus sp.]|nr:energy-coupling factor ABC transporter permease [Phycicoccus sp.]